MSDYLAIKIEFVSVPHGTDDDFEAFLDDVFEELKKIGCDVSLSARLAERSASFVIHADGGDEDDLEARFFSDLRTALHAANCGTPSWPAFVPREQTVREFQPA